MHSENSFDHTFGKTSSDDENNETGIHHLIQKPNASPQFKNNIDLTSPSDVELARNSIIRGSTRLSQSRSSAYFKKIIRQYSKSRLTHNNKKCSPEMESRSSCSSKFSVSPCKSRSFLNLKTFDQENSTKGAQINKQRNDCVNKSRNHLKTRASLSSVNLHSQDDVAFVTTKFKYEEKLKNSITRRMRTKINQLKRLPEVSFIDLEEGYNSKTNRNSLSKYKLEPKQWCGNDEKKSKSRNNNCFESSIKKNYESKTMKCQGKIHKMQKKFSKARFACREIVTIDLRMN